jgi:hypothetical protein
MPEYWNLEGLITFILIYHIYIRNFMLQNDDREETAS